jgi:ribosomal protein S18 acetylase RimI-like enzyme
MSGEQGLYEKYGFEKYYSDQERKMLKAIQEKLNESNDSETGRFVARTDEVL